MLGLVRFARAALGLVVVVGPATADMATFELTREYSGATPPSGNAPWLRASFLSTTPGTVELRLESFLSGTGEFISCWEFNLDSAFDPSLLTFTQDFGPIATIDAQVDKFKAAGTGLYDVRMQWPTGAKKPDRFDSDFDLAEFVITSPEPLTAASFAAFSTGGGNALHGLYTAAHIQGIGRGGDDSGWITTPVPDAGLLAILGLGTLASMRRRLT